MSFVAAGKANYALLSVAFIIEFKQRKLNWHPHTGFFEERNDPIPHRILSRINLDLRDNGALKRRELIAVLFHSMMGTTTPFDGKNASLPPELARRCLENFRDLHDIDRDTIRLPLCDEMLKEIGLLS